MNNELIEAVCSQARRSTGGSGMTSPLETERALLRQCWHSGQISPRQWEQHCREDPALDPVEESAP